ncbi:MAG: hypothetical protein EZS28_028275 [Streblomastix strix]|uniref:Cyclin C-terminal domain-containing protein n=1 Tax=Streblomastix strix TaxID=222440 RepID=A0A5J4V0F4_9EUKA|nr:MAG: hypothetical protein EZS28_028275 [Streblomastix strix]
MERIILSELRYSLGAPTPLTFVKRYAKAAHADSTVGILSRPPWTATLQQYTGYSYDDLVPVLVEIKALVKVAPTLKIQAIFKKYSSQKYLRTALTAVQSI